MRVIATPYPPEAQILDGAGHRHSAYELYVTNWGKTPLKITKLDVNGKDDDKVVVTQSASGKQLAAMFVPVNGDGTKPNDPDLKPGETGVFFIFADWLPGQDDPDTFDTAITIEQHGERSGSGTIHTAALEMNSGRSDRDSLSTARKKLARGERPIEYVGASPRNAAGKRPAAHRPALCDRLDSARRRRQSIHRRRAREQELSRMGSGDSCGRATERSSR